MANTPASPAVSDRPRSAADPLPAPAALRGPGDREQRPTEDILDALAEEKKISKAEAHSALEWFLSEDPEDADEQLVHNVELNLGIGDHEHWITWKVRPVDGDELRRINRQTSAMRKRTRGQDDLAVDILANMRVIVAGSVDPDLQAMADSGDDPLPRLRKKFKHKPGLITQLANQIMALSGFDDEDVRDALIAKN